MLTNLNKKKDPLFTEMLNWHLNPNVDWSNLTGELEKSWNENEDQIKEDVKSLYF